MTVASRLLPAAALTLIAACSSTKTETPLSVAQDAIDAAFAELAAAENGPELGVEQTALLKESVFVAAAIPDDVPGDFTGCYEDALACFVSGNQVDVALRYEPQSGRFWFLDPGSGNTYFANGEMRTVNGFRSIVAALPEQKDTAPVSAPAAPEVRSPKPGEPSAAAAQPTLAGPDIAPGIADLELAAAGTPD
ncbi:MAG: hypothetical protein AAGH41_09100 [Pseudomonadota bacterium]